MGDARSLSAWSRLFGKFQIRWRGSNSRGRLSPWLWLLPALVFVSVFLIYPVIATLRLSFMNANSTAYVGFENYKYIFTNPATQDALLNNILWILLFTLLVLGLGLLFAVLSGRVRYEAVAKAVIFIPMAISFVAASVIWKFMYAYKPGGFEQIGLVNEIATKVGLRPTAWLVEQAVPYTNHVLPSPFHTNNVAIILVGVWMWTGFAMVILSAGLKGLSTEVLEAARVDGATEWQVVRRIIIPMLAPTIAVVATTLIIQALKIFDIVWVTTSGNFNTDVIATMMYKQMFNYQDFGRAGALAVILLLAIVPIMLISVRRVGIQGGAR
jgi:alpha-glucoside transport system permease protein